MNKAVIKKLLKRQEVVVGFFTLIVFAAFSIFSDNFFTLKNFRLILQQFSINGICVLGMSIIIILGGIDLSAGSILAMAGAVGGTLIKAGCPVPVTISASIAIGAVCGMINSMVITKLGVPAIITTIATNYLFRGILVIATGGFWVNMFPKYFTIYGTGRFLGISNVFWMAMILLTVFGFMMQQLNIGRKVYAVGTNTEAADRCGINSERITIFGYTLSGALVGFAGIMYAAQYGAINSSTTGASVGTTVLAAALAGGVNFGGRGTLIGGSIGMLLIAIINNGLIQIKVSEFWIDAITGAIILLALILNVINSREVRKAEE
jgi:ribose/xylose/arabinose/galactoside ABC-type transport system permease subunit